MAPSKGLPRARAQGAPTSSRQLGDVLPGGRQLSVLLASIGHRSGGGVSTFPVKGRLIAVGEARPMLGVCSRTLGRWTAQGRLAERRCPGRRRIFWVPEMEAIQHRRGRAGAQVGAGAVVPWGRLSSRRQAQEGELDGQWWWTLAAANPTISIPAPPLPFHKTLKLDASSPPGGCSGVVRALGAPWVWWTRVGHPIASLTAGMYRRVGPGPASRPRGSPGGGR